MLQNLDLACINPHILFTLSVNDKVAGREFIMNMPTERKQHME